jgi:hypothetical protein
MDEGAFAIMSSLVLGILALGFDRQIARAMTWYSGGVGELFRKQRIWGTFAKPPDPRLTYQNHLSFVRLWGSVLALQGIGLFLLTS